MLLMMIVRRREADRVTWMKATQAAEYAGGVSVKVLYAAVRNGHLKAARIGAGRNLLFSATWVDAWLQGLAEQGTGQARPRPTGTGSAWR